MVAIGFIWVFAQVALVLITMTLISYAFPDSTIGKTLALIK